MTPARRSEIAKHAITERWTLPKATHFSNKTPLIIGNIEIPCYVLDDGRRVLSGRGMQNVLGLDPKKSIKNITSATYPLFKYLSPELIEAVNNGIKFIRPGGTGGIPDTYGYEATLLVDISDAIMEAFKYNNKDPQLALLTAKAEIIIRAVAKVGIIALVDEATGYQEVRDRLALQKILDLYITKELSKWAKRFPNEFYKEIFRLNGWKYDPTSVKRPQLIGKYTNNIVYDRIEVGLLNELRRKNPKEENGKRRATHHQWLTPEVGHPRLAEHIHAVMGIMRISKNWKEFIRNLNVAFPAKGSNLELNL